MELTPKDILVMFAPVAGQLVILAFVYGKLTNQVKTVSEDVSLIKKWMFDRLSP